MDDKTSSEIGPTTRRKSFLKNPESPSKEPTSFNGQEPQKSIEDQSKNDFKTDAKEDSVQGDIEEINSKINKSKDAESNESSPKTGRKRKASEMKLDDLTSEEPPVKEKADEDKIVPEKSSTDSEMETDDLRNVEESLKSDSEKLDLPTGQAFGKGKRARVPNKRYSDFPLTPSRSKSSLSEHIDQAQNGETKDYIESESGSTSDLSGSRSSNIGSPATPSIKKTKAPVDMTNPDYLKPFMFGWKRELVYRATPDSSNKRMGDIYYYTPSGKKVRSMREVSENLKDKNLTLNNFTFFKEPLGLNDPEKETIRDAKVKPGSEKKMSVASPRVTKSSVANSPAASASIPKETKEISAPVVVTKPEEATPKSKKGSGATVKVKLSTPTTKGKVVAKNKQKKKDEELQMGILPPNWQSPTKKSPTRATNSDVGKSCEPCSILCNGVSVKIPSLQCHICLCLYHNECVGLSPHILIPNYVCKNCQLGPEEISASAPEVGPPPPPPLPALTPANPILTPGVATVPTPALPKLQRIPKLCEMPPTADIASKPPPLKPAPSVTDPIGNIDLPKLTPRPGNVNTILQKTSESSVPVTESKSIVGSVTTWFPPSSTIQVSQSSDCLEKSDAGPVPPPRPQFVEYFGNKKYLVIPKHNVVNVSPTIAATATTPPNRLPVNFDGCPGEVLGFTDTQETAAEASSGAEIAPTSVTSSAINNEVLSTAVKTEPISPLNRTNVTDINLTANNVTPYDTTHPILPLSDNGMKNLEVESCRKDGDETDLEPEAKRSSKRLLKAQTPQMDVTKSPEKKLMDNFLQNLSYGYKTLLCVFQYLKVQDLLRASCVCKMWRDIASHPSLWQTVRMKNSQIHSFEGLADALQMHGTVHLDLRKMLLPGNGDEIWPEFSRAIKKVETLRKIELCRCPETVVEQLALSNPKLEVINAVTIKSEVMGLAPLVYLKNLQELRLKSTAGFSLTSDLTALSDLKQLKILSLTSIKDLNKLNIDVIADLSNLVSLELGECSDFPKSFGIDILSRLHKLEKLRLEKGQGNCHTFEILEAVKGMPKMEQLELVNFDIKPGFDIALGACNNIKKLLIIPTYISQSATTNHMVLGGVLRLQSTLLHFVWGVTLELLRVTELFVDQCEDPDKKEKKDKRSMGNGDSIPVLKPVPLLKDGQTTLDILPAQEPPQVEILPLPNLQKLLLQSLPTTRVKILKIPFHATWRQCITDAVN